MDATLFLGIDVGSTTVKVAILDSDNNVLFSDYERHFANIRETLLDLMTKARAELGDRDFHPMITGSGGMSISKYIHVPLFRKLSPFPVPLAILRRRQMLPLSLAVKMQRSFILKTAMWNSV